MYYFSQEELKLLEAVKATLTSAQDKALYRPEKWVVKFNDSHCHHITLMKLILLAKIYRGDYPLIMKKNLVMLILLYEKIINYLIYMVYEEVQFLRFNTRRFEHILTDSVKRKAAAINKAADKTCDHHNTNKLELEALRSLVSIYRDVFVSTYSFRVFKMPPKFENKSIDKEIMSFDIAIL